MTYAETRVKDLLSGENVQGVLDWRETEDRNFSQETKGHGV